MKAALETGYVHLDCAAAYANEDEVGEALEDAFARGVATRTDLFVTSKLWNDRRRPEDVRAGLLQTLKDLRLEYLDLYLIHWPVCWRRGTLMQDDADASILECWRELERCVDEGLIRSIGVSNFSRPKLEELIRDARVKPAVNQIESTRCSQTPSSCDGASPTTSQSPRTPRWLRAARCSRIPP